MLIKINLKTLVLALLPLMSLAQTDTSYYNVNWKPSVKDSATYYRCITKSNELWAVRDFFSQNGKLQMSGNFTDSLCSIKTGMFVWHLIDGTLADSILYVNNKIKEAWYFHDNGNKSAHEVFEGDKLVTAIRWNEVGKEMDENYKDTVYKYKYSSWRDFIESGMRENLPKDYRKGKIHGSVIIEFYIGKDGYVFNAGVKKSSGYPELDNHALNIINNSPRWTPGRRHGRKIVSKREQPFTYDDINGASPN